MSDGYEWLVGTVYVAVSSEGIVYGPFGDEDSAIRWAKNNLKSWYIRPVQHP